MDRGGELGDHYDLRRDHIRPDPSDPLFESHSPVVSAEVLSEFENDPDIMPLVLAKKRRKNK